MGDRKQIKEKLVAVAIIRDGKTHHGFKSHRELRQWLGDTDPAITQKGDREGFWTSTKRFVSRHEAKEVLGGRWTQVARPLLSSDVW